MASLASRLVRRTAVPFIRSQRTGTITADTALDEIDVEAIRRVLDDLGRRAPVPRGTRLRRVDADGVPTAWVEGPWFEPDRIVLWLHGGAHCLGSVLTHRGLAAALGRAARARVLLPEFRLAPEHPYPAAREDALRVWCWALDQGLDPARCALGGESSGGGLAMSTLVALRDRGDPLPSCAVLLSPWVDLTCSGESWQPGVVDDPWLPGELAHLPARAYAGDARLDDPGVSPLFADLSGLPPLLVHVGSDELPRDDGRALVERARAAGVDASLGVWEDMWHAFQAFPGMPESRRALREVGGFVRRHTNAPLAV